MLKEFDLDAPSLSRSKRQLFRLQTRSVTALYERFFKPSDLRCSYWKVMAEVVPSQTKYLSRDLLGVLTVQVIADPEKFFEVGRLAKQRLALKWLMDGIKQVFSERCWASEPFIVASDMVVAANYQNRWEWKKPILNSLRTLSAVVVVEHDVEEARVKVVFRRKRGDETDSHVLCRKPPTEFAFVPCLGKLRWISDSSVKLLSKAGDESWTAAVKDCWQNSGASRSRVSRC